MVLKLESICIYNFKSFKGLHSIDGLNDHFTAIVGPNGSGKSNIIDSILFVLGFKAKKMRHAVLKDLINVGASEAYVELKFNQFVLRRSLKGRLDSSENLKNVISKYELNGKEEQTNEIIQYLKEKGIDLDNNRFLILQGEIETIAMMSPIELLEYIEDCIGTSLFKPKIETLEIEAKSKQEEVDSLMNNLKFIESDFVFKKGRRDSKLELLSFRSESLSMKHRIVELKEEIAKRRETNGRIEKQTLEEQLLKILNENKAESEKIKKLEKSIEKLNVNTKEQELTSYRNEFLRIQRENKNKENKAIRLEKSIEKLMAEQQENSNSLKSWESECKTLSKTLTENNRELTEYENEVKEKTKELNKFPEIKQLENKKTQLEKQLIECLNLKEIHIKQENEIKSLEEKYTNLSQIIQKTKQTKDTEPERIKIENEIKELRKDMDATATEIARRKRKQEENDYTEQLYRKEEEVFENLKGVPGVFGLVKDLANYDRKYEEAIEAATKSLNNVVVDTSRTAEQCISIINRKKLNRTTFIILEKLANPVQVEVPKGKQAEVLYKKIECDSQFSKVFYFIFKDTLLVNTLEEAKEISFGKTRRRVVTLDGKLLEKSGVMCGGKPSKKVKSVSELEEIYKNMSEILHNKISYLSELKNTEIQRKLLVNNTKELERLENELKVRKRDFKDSSNPWDAKIIEIREKLENFENLISPAAVEIKSEIKFLHEKINGIQKINQELKIALGNEPANNQSFLIREIKKLENELKLIQIDPLPDNSRLNKLEEDFAVIYKENKIFEDQISEIRSKMGEKYHEEAQMKTKLEEIIENLKECKKIRENCIQRKNEVLNEFSMIKNLLNQVDFSKNFTLETAVDPFDEMEEAELKAKSRELIEELNRKEAESLKRLKDCDRNESLEDDIEVYRLIFSEFDQSKKTFDEIKNNADFHNGKLISMKSELESLKNQRLKLFLEGYNQINKNIKEIFSLITFGGNAELDLLDYLNPFSEGIVLNIMPPKKAWKQISNLSGGEKTLSSLGLIFALHKFKPSCLYIMDEIDAALDFKNVSIISRYLTHVKSQFIIISLRNDMFEMAKTLIGVYKYENASKAITVDLEAIERM